MLNVSRYRSTSLFYPTFFFAIFLTGLDFIISFLLTESQERYIYSDIASLVFDFLACVALFWAAKQSFNHSKNLGIAWGMIALSALVFALGDTTWSILELGLNEPPFPSLADAFYLLNYPFWLVGILLLSEKSTTSGKQIKKVLDMGIVMIASFLGFWNFLIGPIVSSNAGSPLLEQIILVAYPVGDLVLLWALLQIIYRESNHDDDVPIFLLAAAIIVMIIGDYIYTYQALLDTYMSGGILDISWRSALLISGLAGISQVTVIRSLGTERFPRKFERFIKRFKAITPYLPYLWLIGAYVLLIKSALASLPMGFVPLSLSVGGIICLVLLRQIITLFENEKLNEELQQTTNKLHAQTIELELANRNLQNEIEERKGIEQQLIYDSLHDAMTGLANRVLFLDRLGQAIEYSKRRTEYVFSVLFVDIDQFKVINDSLGHLTGDQLLISVAGRIKGILRSSDTIARLGGDEFAILLEVTGEKNSVLVVIEKIQEALKKSFNIDGHELYITASIGVVMDINEYDNPEDVLRDADIAMYQAKSSGKARFMIFDVKMRFDAFSRLELEQELRIALESQEFQLFYQPIVSFKSNRVVGVEALVRWLHPRRGLLLPGEFLPVAEESGLILPLGRWILHEACMQLKRWQSAYPELKGLSVNVNISNRQFAQPDLVEEVIRALQVNGLKPESLRLEITENVLINNYETANQVFTKLRKLGIQLQIDDFGSGYSALGYLQHFPISTVKIDKSFIDEIGKGRKGTELIRAIISMTRELNMETIAEGIETDEQLHELKCLLCDFGQGFLLSKPLDKETAESILVAQQDKELPKHFRAS